MIGYRMDIHTPEQVAEQDPFDGRGIRLPHPPGMDADKACAAIARMFPEVASASFFTVSWLDGRDQDATALRTAWEGERDEIKNVRA